MFTRHDEQHYRDIINELENDKQDLRDMMAAFGHENTELHRQKRLYNVGKNLMWFMAGFFTCGLADGFEVRPVRVLTALGWVAFCIYMAVASNKKGSK